MPKNSGKPFSPEEKYIIKNDFSSLISNGKSKKDAIHDLGKKYGRGYFSLLNLLNSVKSNSKNTVKKNKNKKII